MADSTPPDGGEGIALANAPSKASEDSPSELESRAPSAITDTDGLFDLAAEFSDAEKATTVPDDDKLAPKGSICKVKEIYDNKTSSCSCCTEWVDEKPGLDRTEEVEAAENRRAQFSIIRRMTPHGANKWKTHSLLINSRSIQAALAKVFEGYPVTYADDHILELTPRYVPFCHRWDNLLEVERNEPDAETKRHLTLLWSTLKTDLSESLKRRDLVVRTGLASFDDLELLFEPGQTLIQGDTESNMAAGIVREVNKEGDDSYYSTPSYRLTVDTVAWNGERFGLTEKKWRLNTFKGTRKIHSLYISPLNMHPDREKISRELVQRGKKYERLRGQHFLAYASSETHLEHIIDRVIIDEEFYWESDSSDRPILKPFNESTTSSSILGVGCCADGDYGFEGTENTADDCASHTGSIHPAPLTDDQLLLTPATVTGFKLKTKTWDDLAISRIREIDWIPDLMSRLVLDQDIKDLIGALIDHKTTPATDYKETFDDFIPGKGRGIVMLLCGPPGVGKTLTAEAVSEYSKSPLYRINVQDLGSGISDMERRLQRAMKRCSHWNAVLLLDEADVFLEQRSINSLERNELVSVFLRELEYYEGIMILTTNRAASIDPAFESRIDVTLKFDALSKEARRQIWDGFLKDTCPAAQLSEEDLDRLADWELNGRQIKSAIKTASIFASQQGGPMTMKHLDVVIKLRNSSGALIGSAKTE